MALSKNKIKYIHSLKDKKCRNEHNTFIVEGHKMVEELLSSLKCQLLIGTNEFINSSNNNIAEETIEVTEDELKKASLLMNPQQVLAVFYQPQYAISKSEIKNKLSLALDEIQDPGNLGTIIRLADWYGIENIFCSKNTADIYNPKTVQATMGAISRVKVHNVDLLHFIESNKDMPIYGTFLDGECMYSKNLSENGIIVMGNEGNGISSNIEKLISHKLYIPNYPKGQTTSESLNVAIATAIICAEFRRRNF